MIKPVYQLLCKIESIYFSKYQQHIFIPLVMSSKHQGLSKSHTSVADAL